MVVYSYTMLKTLVLFPIPEIKCVNRLCDVKWQTIATSTELQYIDIKPVMVEKQACITYRPMSRQKTPHQKLYSNWVINSPSGPDIEIYSIIALRFQPTRCRHWRLLFVNTQILKMNNNPPLHPHVCILDASNNNLVQTRHIQSIILLMYKNILYDLDLPSEFPQHSELKQRFISA